MFLVFSVLRLVAQAAADVAAGNDGARPAERTGPDHWGLLVVKDVISTLLLGTAGLAVAYGVMKTVDDGLAHEAAAALLGLPWLPYAIVGVLLGGDSLLSAIMRRFGASSPWGAAKSAADAVAHGAAMVATMMLQVVILSGLLLHLGYLYWKRRQRRTAVARRFARRHITTP